MQTAVRDELPKPANGRPQQPSKALQALQQIANALPLCGVSIPQHNQLSECVQVLARELDRLEKEAEKAPAKDVE